MTDMHKSSLLPIKNRVLSADEHTAFLAHYDLNEHDVLRGVKAIGGTAALNFGGTTYVNCNNSATLLKTNDDFSMTCWFNTTHNPSVIHGSVIFSAHNVGGGINLFRIGIGPNGSIYYSAQTDMANGSSYNDGKWHHLAVTVAGSDGIPHVYVDGIEVTGFSGSKILWTDAVLMSIGQEYDGASPSDFYRGRLMDVKIYKRILSSEETKKSAYSLIERDLIGHWKLDEGRGNVARDSSPFHNDGIIINPSWTTGNLNFTLLPHEGKFGGAVAIEEGTTNIFPAASIYFESGWSGYDGAEITKTQNIYVPEWGIHHATRLTTKGGTNVMKTYRSILGQNTIEEGKRFAVQIKVKNIGTNTVHVHSNRASTYLTKSQVQPGETMVVKWVTNSSPIGTNGDMQIQLRGLNIGDELDFIVADPQAEEKTFHTSFVNGTRNNGLLEYAIPLTGDFTIALYYKSVAPNGYTKDRNVIALTNGTNHFNFFNGYGTDWYMGDEITRTRFSLSLKPVPVNDFEHLVIVREGAIVKLYRNSILTDSKDFGAAPTFTRLSLCGGYGSQGQKPNGIIDELRVDTIARTEEEILAWYESNSPFWPRGIYRKSY